MYLIMGKYLPTNKSEEIDSADSMEEAVLLLNEYKTAFGNDWALSIKREKFC